VSIESNCPVNFEYDIEILKPHPDITVGKVKCRFLNFYRTLERRYLWNANY
jgi:hypothetical protein